MQLIPVDSRSLFRGNYARLNYDISRIRADAFPDSGELRNGERVYVLLKQGTDGLYVFDGSSLNPPDKGVFLRGRIANSIRENDIDYFRIRYGIEAFFAPKEKAIELEKQPASGGIGVLMVTNSGKAALKNVIP